MLCRCSRENGCSVFVDGELRPFDDQWAFLASIQPMAPHDIEPTILRATGGVHPLDVTFIDEIQFAKINGHDPYVYLKDVLARLPTQKASAIDELLPHYWVSTDKR